MSNTYESENTKDNEKRKFQPDSSGDVAVNIIGEQLQGIIDAINTSQSITKQNPRIYNISCPVANTEYSQSLSNNTKSFTLRVRDRSDLNLAFQTGQTSTNFVTIKKGAVYTENDLGATGLTLYFESNDPNITVEIVEWT